MNGLKIFFLFICFASIEICSAQENFLKRADKLYDREVYNEAAEIYRTYLQQTYDFDVNYKLAECYRHLNLTREAAFWYEIIAQQKPDDPDILLNYANLLKSNGKYRSAKQYYLKYAAFEDDGYYLASTCDWALSNLTKQTDYFLDTININTSGSEMTPTFFKKGFIFAGPGEKADPNTGLNYYDLYFADLKNDTTWAFKPLADEINSDLHEASPCYSPNAKVLYFTRNNHVRSRTIKSKDGEVKLELYFSTYKDNKFSTPRPSLINSKSYSIGQPALSPDGTILIFASDRPGGYGGIDLYYTIKKSTGWSGIKNLGPTINTGGDELFPSMDSEGTLYYSSNWLAGFGGLDVFESKREGDHWTAPVNLGLPVNSSFDDFGFIINNGSGFVTSNRPGGKGSDDIYSVAKLKAITTLYVHDTNLKPVYKAKLSFVENPKTQNIGETDVNGIVDVSTITGASTSIRIIKEGFLEKVINNLGSYRSSNGTLPVELQPLLGNNEKNPTQENESSGTE
ncbi:MAG: hypothetical protein ACHQFW_11830 [Chitinophagales bacterium]